MSINDKEFKDKLLINSLLTFKFYEPNELIKYISFFKKCRKYTYLDQDKIEGALTKIYSYIQNQFDKEFNSFKNQVETLQETKQLYHFTIQDDCGNTKMIRPIFVSLRRIEQAIAIEEIKESLPKDSLTEIESLVKIVKQYVKNDVYVSETSPDKYFKSGNYKYTRSNSPEIESIGSLIGIIIFAIIILFPILLLLGGLFEKDDRLNSITIDCNNSEMAKYSKYCNGEAEYQDKIQQNLEDRQWNNVRPY